MSKNKVNHVFHDKAHNFTVFPLIILYFMGLASVNREFCNFYYNAYPTDFKPQNFDTSYILLKYNGALGHL